MDPNATLAEAREYVQRILEGESFDDGDATRLAELFQALDQWITRGGFLPKSWARGVSGNG